MESETMKKWLLLLYYFFLKYLVETTGETIHPEFFFVGTLLTTNSINYKFINNV